MKGMTLDWNAIRPLNGARDKGFEELCSQLARCEAPPDARFIRKGTPDAGVECYAVLPDESEWAWQAKYFLASPEKSQWQQVNDSVLTALKRHPSITRYYVCMPLELPDGRVEIKTKNSGKTKRTITAYDKWIEHIKKWKGAAAKEGRDVEFVFWGSHELLELLVKPRHVGRVRFWFDKVGFDSAWFSTRIEEAIRTAGPRYTPEVHIDLPIALEFEAFGRTERFFRGIKRHARHIRKKLQNFGHEHSKAKESPKN